MYCDFLPGYKIKKKEALSLINLIIIIIFISFAL